MQWAHNGTDCKDNQIVSSLERCSVAIIIKNQLILMEKSYKELFPMINSPILLYCSIHSHY